MIPFLPVADDECFTGGPMRGMAWRSWVTDARHMITTRGRPALACRGIHWPIHLSSPVAVSIPIEAIPHETSYDVRLLLSTYITGARGGRQVQWAMSSADRVGGGGVSAVQAPGIIDLADDPKEEALYLASGGAVDCVAYWWPYPLLYRWSDWLHHECNQALLTDRVLTITVTWPTGLPGDACRTFIEGMFAWGNGKESL